MATIIEYQFQFISKRQRLYPAFWLRLTSKLNSPRLPFLHSKPCILIPIQFHPRLFGICIPLIKVIQVYVISPAISVHICPIANAQFPVPKNYVFLVSPSVNCMLLRFHCKSMIVGQGKDERLFWRVSDFLSPFVFKAILSAKLMWIRTETSDNLLLVSLAYNQ